MISPDKHPKEVERLKALRKYDISYEVPQLFYDDAARIVKFVCNADASIVSFVEDTKQYFKAHCDLDGLGADRTHSMCGHTILEAAHFLEILDTDKDARFQGNEVLASLSIKYYVGATINDINTGLPLGTICGLGNTPRERGITEKQKEILFILSRQIANFVELEYQIDKMIEDIKGSHQRSEADIALCLDTVTTLLDKREKMYSKREDTLGGLTENTELKIEPPKKFAILTRISKAVSSLVSNDTAVCKKTIGCEKCPVNSVCSGVELIIHNRESAQEARLEEFNNTMKGGTNDKKA